LGQQQHCRLPGWIWETTVEQGFFFNFLKDKSTRRAAEYIKGDKTQTGQFPFMFSVSS